MDTLFPFSAAALQYNQKEIRCIINIQYNKAINLKHLISQSINFKWEVEIECEQIMKGVKEREGYGSIVGVALDHLLRGARWMKSYC